jgi:hypothetical protein
MTSHLRLKLPNSEICSPVLNGESYWTSENPSRTSFRLVAARATSLLECTKRVAASGTPEDVVLHGRLW